MTDDVLLKKIEEIIAPLKQDIKVVKQDIVDLRQDFEGQMDAIGGRLQYLEVAERSLVAFYELSNATQQELKNQLEEIRIEQQKQGKDLKYLRGKVNRINKSVDIMVSTYDERIVKNAREIERIKSQQRYS